MKNSLWFVGVLSLLLASTGGAADDRASDLHAPQAAVRARAVQELGRVARVAAVPALVEALRDADAAVRREAARALGTIKDGRAALPLVDALADGDENVRMYAAYALGEIKDRRAAAALLSALRDPQYSVRDQAAWALREIGDASQLDLLCAALAEPTADVPHLLWLIKHLGGPKAVSPLAALLTASDLETRRRALRGLREFGDPATAPALNVALRDRDEDLRRQAVDGLLALGSEVAEQPLREMLTHEQNQALRALVEKSLVRMGKQETLAAHWSFDDRSTKTARDITGHGNDGEIRGCVAVEGRVGAALQFGPGKFIELGKPSALPMAGQPFTVMAWVKTAAPNGVVVARGGAFCGYSLYVKDGLPKFGIRTQREKGPHIAASKQSLPSAWTHLAGVVCRDRVELYVNGLLAATAKSDGYFGGNCGQGMEIGFDAGNSAVEITDAFDGLIDEVKVYQAELTAKDLARECGR